jgi:hypothetical protein
MDIGKFKTKYNGVLNDNKNVILNKFNYNLSISNNNDALIKNIEIHNQEILKKTNDILQLNFDLNTK